MSFKRAYDEGIPVTDANFFANASKADIKHIFRTATGVDIPLLDERVFILNENARILLRDFSGQFTNVIKAADHDAVKLLKLIRKHFPSFDDVAMYNKHDVIFLKLLHLLALDLNLRFTESFNKPFLKNMNKLAVFADYKLPQLLRMFGILEYDKELAELVDSYTEIAQGSAYEVEMRAGAIWAVELLRQRLGGPTAIEVGHVIWLMSQDQDLQKKIKPYHRTYTTYY